MVNMFQLRMPKSFVFFIMRMKSSCETQPSPPELAWATSSNSSSSMQTSPNYRLAFLSQRRDIFPLPSSSKSLKANFICYTGSRWAIFLQAKARTESKSMSPFFSWSRTICLTSSFFSWNPRAMKKSLSYRDSITPSSSRSSRRKALAISSCCSWLSSTYFLRMETDPAFIFNCSCQLCFRIMNGARLIRTEQQLRSSSYFPSESASLSRQLITPPRSHLLQSVVCQYKSVVAKIETQNSKQKVNRFRLLRNNRPLLAAPPKQALRLDEFFEASMFKFILKEVRLAVVLTAMLLSNSDLKLTQLKPARVNFVATSAHQFLFQNLLREDQELLKMFEKTLTRVLKRFSSWVVVKSVKRPNNVWQLIRGVSDFNQLFKLESKLRLNSLPSSST